MELLLRCLYILSSPDGSKPAGVDSSKAGLARPDASLNVPPASSHPTSRRKCAASKSPWFLIQDKKKNKQPKSRRDLYRSYRLRHLFHFPPSCHHSPWTPSPPALRSPPSGALQAPSQGGLLGALSHLPSLSLQPTQPLLLPLPPHLGVRLLPWVGLVRHGDSSLTTESRVEGRERKKKVSFHLMADRKTGGSAGGEWG